MFRDGKDRGKVRTDMSVRTWHRRRTSYVVNSEGTGLADETLEMESNAFLSRA